MTRGMSGTAERRPESVGGQATPSTMAVTRVVEPGHEQEYRAWRSRLIIAAEEAPLSLGTVVLAPIPGESKTFGLIHRFADAASLRAWEDSDARRDLSEEADRFSSFERPADAGLEQWFSSSDESAQSSPARQSSPASQSSPVKWRMVIVTFAITYALTAIIIPRETAWLPKSWSFYESNVITNVLLALAMTYLLPLITRLLRRWLY